MTNRRQYKLNNLDCASCASKIEERLSAIDAFSEVSVSFPTATLTLKAEGEPRALADRINLEISRVEPGCVAVEVSSDQAGAIRNRATAIHMAKRKANGRLAP